MSTKQLILVEDQLRNQSEYKKAFERFSNQIHLIELFRNELDAFTFVRQNPSAVDGIITDLRILSGPTQEFSPPIDTDYVYGVKLMKDLSEAHIVNIPVVAYSSYLGSVGGRASPTKRAATKALADYPFLIGVFPAEPDRNAFALKVLNAFNKHWAAQVARS